MPSRFRVTIHDRKKGRVQHYDVDRILQSLCLPRPDGKGEDWMVSMRAVSHEEVAQAIAIMFGRIEEVMGGVPLYVGIEMWLDEAFKPSNQSVIDYEPK